MVKSSLLLSFKKEGLSLLKKRNKKLLFVGVSGLLVAAAGPAPVHQFLSVAVSPDGVHVASIEGDVSAAGTADIKQIVIRSVTNGAAVTVKLPCGAVRECTPSSLTWSPDGKHLAFVLRVPGSHDHSIYTVDPSGSTPTRLLAFNGTLEDLRYTPSGTLAVLATAGAAKEVGAVEAGAAEVGVLGTDVHEQRIATIGTDNTLHWASPPDLFVYEYDARPNNQGFVGTAAHGDGDNNWWVAKLYAFAPSGAASVIYNPATPQQQLANPRVSPDGKIVTFIAGLMSDFTATGGEAYILPLSPGARAQSITPHFPSTVQALSWSCDGTHLLASVQHLDQSQLMLLGLTPTSTPPAALFSAPETLGGDGLGIATDCHTILTAAIHQTFTSAPEIETGPIGHWQNLTHSNAAQHVAAHAQSIAWSSDQFHPQGWLILPDHTAAGAKIPMITQVHGGPSWLNRPAFIGAGLDHRLLDAGYALFLPNPRGSYGQGEAFTSANVKDFGYGDLRDILAGVTAAEHAAPIDDHRLGLIGWSYGGYMTMWTVTQTNRFRAAVAGAGIANWQSYYGENGIDAWMIPFFGASVYADPAVYAKSAPITFITHVHTPTLEVVGENDIECPAPQTEEFWHALNALGVPTESVIYPGEGHAMRNPAHIEDFQRRTLAWFAKYLR